MSGTCLLARLDKRPPYIMIADDAELKGDAGFLGITHRRRRPRIGNRNDDRNPVATDTSRRLQFRFRTINHPATRSGQ